MFDITHINQIIAKNPILLLVEDRLTAEYLSIIWQDDAKFFGFGIGGGNETVKGMVHDLRTQGIENVFGFIDRDFRKSNEPRWADINSDVKVFEPTVHEIENFLLLSWEAIEGCSLNKRNRTQEDIKNRSESYAQEMVCWMACRSVLSHYRDRLVGDFPEHPPLGSINNQHEAENYITSQNWYNSLKDSFSHIFDETSLSSDLSEAYEKHKQQLRDETWVREFSGKEIFRRVRGYLFEEKAYDSPSVMDEDLAKSIADWQVENNSVPEELIDLKNSLKERVGLS